MTFRLNRIIPAVLTAGWLAFSVLIVPASGEPNPSAFENWKTDFERYNTKLSDIRSGGPPKDGIPAINDPKFISFDEAKQLGERDPVVGLEINGDARAYSFGVLMRHEIVNDIVGGQAVAITYCPLCNSAVVFDAMIDGKRHDFGTTGRLRKSNLIMYDRQTESWWQQFSGKGMIGRYTGEQLVVIPSRVESFANFKKRFPEGKVLAGVNGTLSGYGYNPYTGYDTAAKPFLFNGDFPPNINPMERVVVVRDGDTPLAVSMVSVREKGTMTVSGIDISWSEGQSSALDTSRISNGREVGNIVVTRMVDGKARDVAYDVTFAFVAHAFMPDVAIIK